MQRRICTLKTSWALALAVSLIQPVWAQETAPATLSPPADVAAKPRIPEGMEDIAQHAADAFKQQNYEGAAADYQRIIDAHPDSLYAWSNLGVVRMTQHKYGGALLAFNRSLELSPKDASSVANLGITLYFLAKYDEAVETLKKALLLNPNDARCHNYLGCCYTQKGDIASAKAEFQRAIELDSHQGEACFNIALIYATVKPVDLEKARSFYVRAKELGIAPDARLENLAPPQKSYSTD